jgi:hypothetical protein
MKPKLKAPEIDLVTLKYNEPLSTFTFNFNLRRYILALKISQRLVAFSGGVLFIVFAWHALIFGAPGADVTS